MIIIDRINEGKSHWYRFPTIDLKFQNRGSATAFLWQFAVEIVHAEIDQTPVLDFKSDVNAGTLLIGVTNNGWGDAQNCHVSIDEPILNLLFPDSVRQYTGTLQSGKQQNIFQYSTATADTQQLQILKGQFKDLPFRRQDCGLCLESLNVSWQSNDGQHKGIQKRGGIVLTEFGFDELILATFPIRVPSDTTYGAIVDPSVGSHERKYSISRKIPSGDVERFHIMIGSPMSCYLQVRFKFFIDQATIIESNIFNINIWNPRDSEWHLKYTDEVSEVNLYSSDSKRRFDASIFPLTHPKD